MLTIIWEMGKMTRTRTDDVFSSSMRVCLNTINSGCGCVHVFLSVGFRTALAVCADVRAFVRVSA